MSQIVVPTDTPGLLGQPQARQARQPVVSDTAELSFVDVRVPVANTIGEIGRGFQQQMAQFQNERMIAAYMAVGGMQAALERTVAYVNERAGLRRSRCVANQHVQFALAELIAEVDVLRHYNYACAEAYLPRRGHHPVRHHRQAEDRPAEPPGGRHVPPVPRRHRLHGGDVDGALLPRLAPALHRRRRRRGHAAASSPSWKVLARSVDGSRAAGPSERTLGQGLQFVGPALGVAEGSERTL